MALTTPPNNLGISRQLSLTIVAIGVCITLVALIGGVVFGKVDGSVISVLVGQLGLLLAGIAGSVKATETADTAAKTHQTLELTASQQASIAQILMAHCGDICPLDNCPLKGSHVYGTAISVPPGSGIDLAGGERQSS